MNHFEYKKQIDYYVKGINEICTEGIYYEANFISRLGGWRLIAKYKFTGSERATSICNIYRMNTKAFFDFISSIYKALTDINKLTKPF